VVLVVIGALHYIGVVLVVDGVVLVVDGSGSGSG